MQQCMCVVKLGMNSLYVMEWNENILLHVDKLTAK